MIHTEIDAFLRFVCFWRKRKVNNIIVFLLLCPSSLLFLIIFFSRLKEMHELVDTTEKAAQVINLL